MPGNQGAPTGARPLRIQRGLVFVTNVNQVALLRVTDVKDPQRAAAAAVAAVRSTVP